MDADGENLGLFLDYNKGIYLIRREREKERDRVNWNRVTAAMNLDDVIRLDKLVAFAPNNTHAPERHFHFDS